MNNTNHTHNSIDHDIKYNLALAYQTASQLGLDDLTYTHISARSTDKNYFYIYPFGMLYGEVTTTCFLEVNLSNGTIKNPEAGVFNKTGYAIHSSIYNNNKSINAVIHLHTPARVAVSNHKKGLLPISQSALHFYNQVEYFDYDSLILHSQHDATTNSLGKDKKVIFLRHHGFITLGQTIHEAFFYAYHLEMACKTQCLSLANGQNLILLDDELCHKSNKDLLSFESDLGIRDWQAYKRKYGYLVK